MVNCGEEQQNITTDKYIGGNTGQNFRWMLTEIDEWKTDKIDVWQDGQIYRLNDGEK